MRFTVFSTSTEAYTLHGDQYCLVHWILQPRMRLDSSVLNIDSIS